MIIVFIGIYLIFLALIWGFFIVAKIHSYKFKDFSPNIEKVTKALAIALFVLTLVGFILLFNYRGSLYTVKINNINADNLNQQNY
ncbi:MAG: hypothetical protein PHG82_02835 [Candidatus Gracilibacteria bacterium]|nr:hypothetical protein [Candidatus Gracilibacteria bacterium]